MSFCLLMVKQKKQILRVCFSLDVEEEGLFGGQYQARNTSVKNLEFLRLLEPVCKDFGIPLTLFCAHSVFGDRQARSSLAYMRDHCGAEIAAHLHHWSTPPYDANSRAGKPTPTHLLPPHLLAERLDFLLAACADFQGAPVTAFRMGRWDLKAQLLPLLAQRGIKVDSSICPLRFFRNGPDHFFAPADPYIALLPDKLEIFEAPITQIPLLRFLPSLWRGLAGKERLDLFHFFGALSANPVWHNAFVMRLATRLHAARGGKALNFFLHSSELMPGGSPHIPDRKTSQALVKKIIAFCKWLTQNFQIQGVTASQLPDLDLSFPRLPLLNGQDW